MADVNRSGPNVVKPPGVRPDVSQDNLGSGLWPCYLGVLQPEAIFYHLSELLFHQSIFTGGSTRQVFDT